MQRKGAPTFWVSAAQSRIESIHPAQAVQPVDLQLCGKRWWKKNILTWLRPKIGYTLFSIDDLSISPYVNIFKWLFGVYTPVSKKSISVAAACGRPGMRLGSIHGIMMPVTSWMLPKIWKVNEDHRCWPLLTYLHIFSWRIRFESVQIIESCWEWISLRNHDLSH